MLFSLRAEAVCLEKDIQIKAEIHVTLDTGLEVEVAGSTEVAPLIHDVNESVTLPDLSGTDARDGQGQFLFVVEVRVTFISVEHKLVISIDFPYSQWYS